MVPAGELGEREGDDLVVASIEGRFLVGRELRYKSPENLELYEVEQSYRTCNVMRTHQGDVARQLLPLCRHKVFR